MSPTRAHRRARAPPTIRPARRRAGPCARGSRRSAGRGRAARRGGGGPRGRRPRRGRSRCRGRSRSGPRPCPRRGPPRSARRTSPSGVPPDRRSAAGPVLSGWPLDVRQDVAAAAVGREIEQLGVSRPADVVDGDGAGVEARGGDLGGEGVGRDREAGPLGEPAIAGARWAASSAGGTGGPLRPPRRPRRACRTRLRPERARPRPPARASRCALPRTSSRRDVHDPGPERPVQLERPVGQSPGRGHGPTVTARPTAYGYRCARWPYVASTPTSTAPCWAVRLPVP